MARADGSSEIRYFPYSDARQAETLDLMNRVHGFVTTPEEFDWWFNRNPGGERNIFLAEMNGKVVGVLSLTPYEMTFAGQAETVGFGQKLCVDEICRGRGVFLKMQAQLESVARARGMKFFLGFPNAKAYPIWTGKWKALDLARPRLLLRPQRLSAALTHSRVPSTIASLAPAARNHGHIAPLRPARFGYNLRSVRHFDGSADALWARVARAATRRAGCIARTSRYLNWRYLDGPRASYRATGAYSAQSLEGYVFTGVTERDGVRIGFIADLLASSDNARRAVLDHALSDLHAEGVAATLAIEPIDLKERLLFASRLFLPTPKRFPVISKALDGNEARVRAFLKPGLLRFTLGDLDFL